MLPNCRPMRDGINGREDLIHRSHDEQRKANRFVDVSTLDNLRGLRFPHDLLNNGCMQCYKI
ncbi:hypothetical protein M378DRAFT_801490 [Amanita muscaria Koide BX008]|uniref:Uncharacterized protein n=1 Tax=Amanita muscaria (strain Koide BX008) TaxID=946122 RepID=A0A0C2WZ83_AMAMK|nr:hypothetical protein M378DRAFT_801490 [Amanita muscaria Koide BX008]